MIQLSFHRRAAISVGILTLSLLLARELSAQTNPAPGTTAAAPAAETPVELNEFIVTGSYIPQTSFHDSGSPIAVVTTSDIARVGAVANASDFLRYQTANVGAWSQEVGTGTGGLGGGTLNLRGLGNGASLVLLDGYRMTRIPGATDGSVNVNALVPVIDIARVDILKDGASSLYGSDAVGGVANYITRDDFTGAEVNSDYRFYTHHRYTSKQTTQAGIFGAQMGKVTVVGSFEYLKRTPLLAGEAGVTAQDQPAASSGSGFPGTFRVPTRNAAGQLTGSTVSMADPLCAKVQSDGITNNKHGEGTDSYLAGGVCRLAFSNFVLINDTQSWRGRMAATVRMSDRLTFKASFAGNITDVVNFGNPSQPVTRATVTVPGTNPGNPFRAVNASGQPLYAVPNPAKPSAPQLDANGNAVLTSDPTNPASGVAFNENVIASSWRPYSSTNAPAPFPFLNQAQTFRGDAGLRGEFGQHWMWDVHYTYSQQKTLLQSGDDLLSNVIAGVNGTLGPKNNQYLNPFADSLYATPGSAQYNDPALFPLISTRAESNFITSLSSFDGVLSGELGRLPSGPVRIAVGGQSRTETLQENFDPLQFLGLLASIPPANNFLGSLTTNAAFVEVRLPVFDDSHGKLEFAGAGRYETDSHSHSSNPKISLLYKRDWLALRGSFGTSFLAPSLFQKFGNSGNGGQTVVDPLTGGSSVAGIYTVGNPNAQPQKSQAYNAGFTVEPIKGLTFSVDYWRFKFTNLLATLAFQAQVNLAPNGPNILRAPVTGEIIQVTVPFFNAGSLKTDGVDLEANYRMSLGDTSHLNFFADATEINSYNAQVFSTSVPIKGVNKDNANNFGFPMAKWRANGGLVWDHKEQSASLIVRYFTRVYSTSAPAQSAHPQTKLDFQYNYDLHKILPGLRLTVGVLNVLDTLPNILPVQGNGYYIHQLQDPQPRQVYTNATYSF